MLFGLFTLFVALVISGVAAYYSIVGLTAIFSAAVVPIIIMGAALEVGKVTAAVWLKLNWARARWTYKVYLVPAVAFLMLLTSMGIFGFLSKAHSDQNLVSGDVQSKIAIYDEKIKTARENIDANRRQLKQMDEAVDQVMARSTSEEGATKANNIRRSQQRDRTAIAKDIEANQKLIASLNDESAPIRAEVRKVEAEVGPIKYVAALIYGDNPDANLLERAVRWVIILIVAVFDPLALVLILAAQQSLRWARDDKEEKEQEPKVEEPVSEEFVQAFAAAPGAAPALTPDLMAASDKPDAWVADVGEKPTKEELAWTDRDFEELATETFKDIPPAEITQPVEHTIETHPYLSQGFRYPPGWMFVGPLVAETPVEKKEIETQPQPEVPRYIVLEGGYVEIDGKTMHHSVVRDLYPEVQADIDKRLDELGLKATADNLPIGAKPSKATFGIELPKNPEKGEMFLNVATLPTRLYKFNGDRWIEVDKSVTDSYTFNEDYLRFLVEKIKLGHINPDDLSEQEQEQITEYLKKNV